MNDFEGPEYSCQSDVIGESSAHFRIEIPGIFNDDVHSSSVLQNRDRPCPCEEKLLRPILDESHRNDEFAAYRFCCPFLCDPSPSLAQYASVPCPDHILPRSSSLHFLNPLPGLGKNEPQTWAPEGAIPYDMSSAEVRDAVASICTEGAEEHSQPTYSIQDSDGDLRQCNQLYLEQISPHNQPMQKLPVCTSNMCQVVCSGNSRGHMVLLNHCSPTQILHPLPLGSGAPGSKPSWCSADLTLSPQHPHSQGRGDDLAVHSCQIQPGLSSQLYLPPFSCSSAITQPPLSCPSIISPASSCTFNLMPAPYISQAPCPVHLDTVDRRLEEQANKSSRVSWEKLKKPCNCTKSQCLKLYCDCFANGEVCSNCNCINCCNNMEHESERCRAIKICLDRNPEAFHPKIDVKKRGYLKGRHTKGCNCKRSGCLKNYCECYEAKIMCSSTCKCVGCRNYGGSPARERARWDSPHSSYGPYSIAQSHNTKGPLSCITPDVVEATCGCLLAQAEEAEKDQRSLPHAQRMILDEFGQCLTQIVHSIFKSARVQW